MNSQARKRGRQTPTSDADDPYPTRDTSRIKHAIVSWIRRGCAGTTGCGSGGAYFREREPKIACQFRKRTPIFLPRSSAGLTREKGVLRLAPPNSGAHCGQDQASHASYGATSPHRTRTVRTPSRRARFWRASGAPAPTRCTTTPVSRDRSPDVRSNPSRARRACFTYTKSTCAPVNPMVRITCCDAWGDRRHSREVLYESTWLRVLTSQVL
jgi:hypothetical protein